MTKIINIKFLSFFSLLMAIIMITSCKKDNAPGSDKVELLSFGPTGAMHGDTLRFIGHNLNIVTAIDFTGVSVAQSSFITQDNELITVVVPAAAEKGLVTLKSPQGDIVSKTQFNLEVLPKIGSITREARPGQDITLTGQYLNWVTRVTFANDKHVDTFVSKSLNQLVVKVPVDAQTGPLVINYSGTKPLKFQTADTVRVTLPVATAMSPNPVKHQDNLTITGTNLDLVKQIRFTGVTSAVTSFVSQSATTLVVRVPASTTKGKITLVAASGVVTQSANDLDLMMPSVSAMSPDPVDPGANLTVTGTNLDLVSTITFNNAPAVTAFVSQTATQIVVRVPTGVASGRITLGVKNSTLSVQSTDVLGITGDAPPPVIAKPIYKDAVTTNWNGWVGDGWGGTKNYANANPVREGTHSVKIDYVGGYGAPMQLGGGNMDVTGFTMFKVSIYGAPGSAGKRVSLSINGTDAYTITLIESKWTDYSVALSSLTTTNRITEILVKEYSGTGGFTIYVDAMGVN
jgi:hypothetical protein